MLQVFNKIKVILEFIVIQMMLKNAKKIMELIAIKKQDIYALQQMELHLCFQFIA